MPPKKVATKSGVTPKKQILRPNNKEQTTTKTVNKQSTGNNLNLCYLFHSTVRIIILQCCLYQSSSSYPILNNKLKSPSFIFLKIYITAKRILSLNFFKPYTFR